MTKHENGLTVYQCHAWGYVPSTVKVRISASSPSIAVQMLKEREKNDGSFWDDQSTGEDDGSGTHYEAWDCSGLEQLHAEPGHELAPDGATDLLREMLQEMVEFDAQCRETEYTDTDVVWDIFDRFQARIRETLGKEETKVAA